MAEPLLHVVACRWPEEVRRGAVTVADPTLLVEPEATAGVGRV